MAVIEKTIKLSELKEHPDNPRSINEQGLENLKTSLTDMPEMLEARPIVVNKDNQIIGGSQRYRALLELGETETKVKVVDWSEDKQREFIIKDNVNKGEWDYNALLNEWKAEDLSRWGVRTMTWAPVLDPNQDDHEYSDEDIQRAENRLENRFSADGDGSDSYVTIICKGCGKEYYADHV